MSNDVDRLVVLSIIYSEHKAQRQLYSTYILYTSGLSLDNIH